MLWTAKSVQPIFENLSWRNSQNRKKIFVFVSLDHLQNLANSVSSMQFIALQPQPPGECSQDSGGVNMIELQHNINIEEVLWKTSIDSDNTR